MISHSDTPNIRVVPFFYSPKNELGDPEAISYNIMWPLNDIRDQDGLCKNFLHGMNETDDFRSARLHTWYAIPEEFLKLALETLRKKHANNNEINAKHDQLQSSSPEAEVVQKEVLKVFTEDKEIMKTLTSEKYQFCDFEEADVHWLLGIQRG